MVTMTKPTSPVDHPEIAGFLASVEPDPELAQLGEALRGLSDRRAALNARAGEIARRAREIDGALLDAAPKDRDRLLIERAALGGEQASLPHQLGTLVERLAMTELRYLATVRRLALAEAERAEADLAGPKEANGAVINTIARADNSRNVERRLSPEQRVELYGESRRLVAEMRPAADRRDRATLVAGICSARASALYGVNVDKEHLWGEAVQVAAQRAARALRAGG